MSPAAELRDWQKIPFDSLRGSYGLPGIVGSLLSSSFSSWSTLLESLSPLPALLPLDDDVRLLFACFAVLLPEFAAVEPGEDDVDEDAVPRLLFVL